jgi:hypothetical protein
VNEIIAALSPVVTALEKLGVRYRVGGSVASSALGVPRSTLDIDVACELKAPQARAFVTALGADYYADEGMVLDAIARHASFNVIHLATMLKVDVFIRKDTPFEKASFERVVQKPLEPGGRAFDFTSAEDIILHKLIWYELGGRISERQWNDVVGVIAVQRASLDLDYLRRWAGSLDVGELLARALGQSS